MSAPLGVFVAVAELIHARLADVQTMIQPSASAGPPQDPNPRSRKYLRPLRSNPTRLSALSNQEYPNSTIYQSVAHALK